MIIVRSILAFVIYMSILYLGWSFILKFFIMPKTNTFGLNEWINLMGLYFLVIEPIGNYWTNIVLDLCGFKKK